MAVLAMQPSTAERNERRKAGVRIRNLTPLNEDLPVIRDTKGKLRGEWTSSHSSSSGAPRLKLSSLPRYGKNAQTYKIVKGECVSSKIKRVHRDSVFRSHINVDFVRQAGLPYMLNQRVTLHGILSELLYRREDQASFITVLLEPCQIACFADGSWIRTVFAKFLDDLRKIMTDHPDAVFHFQGFTEACIHTVSMSDIGSKSSYLRSFIGQKAGISSRDGDWVVPHVHLLATAFDTLGVWPTVRWRQSLQTSYGLSNQLRCQNLGKLKRFDDVVGKHARRAITYAKKTKRRKGTSAKMHDLECALSFIVHDNLPNNGWFELKHPHYRKIPHEDAVTFFENRENILQERMPEGFIGFDDDLEQLVDRIPTHMQGEVLSQRALSLVLNSGAPAAGTSDHNAKLVQHRVTMDLSNLRCWGDIRCKICLSDECNCLGDDDALFNRIQMNGYADAWYDDTIFETQRIRANFMSNAQRQAMDSRNGTFRPHWPRYLTDYRAA